MAQKNAKKAPVKKTAEKKATIVKATAKKTITKKTVATKVAPKKIDECACGCGCECAKQHGTCECCKNMRRVIIRKLIITLIIFSLGFVSAKLTCCCHKKSAFRGPRVEFVNGCLNPASVKCDHMREILPEIDANNDGCVSHDEWKAARPKMRGGNIVRETEHEADIIPVENKDVVAE